MSIVTSYDVMDCIEREITFKAYDYNSHKKIYIIAKPELLTNAIIKKLV
jgi:uncharacterized protein YbjT (DUF2867 family)